MIEKKCAEMKNEHRTVITESRSDVEKNNGNEKMRTSETVVAVLKHKS